MTNSNIKQFSVKALLLLIFIPALLIFGTYSWAIRFRNTIPPFLSFVIIIFLVLTPIEIGIILYFSKKEYGKLNLKSALIHQEKISVTDMIGLSSALFIFAAIVFTVISPIESNFMFKTLFSKVPEYYKLSDFFRNYEDYSKGIVITSLVLYVIGDGILGPIVEELYFRGFIMPRINRFGIWTPIIISVLFSAYHLFSPWEFITRIIACFPFVYCVYKKNNIYIGMVVHCTLNTASVILSIISIFA